MKTTSLPSAIIGQIKTNKQLLSGATMTDTPQLGSFLPNKALRSFVLLSIFVLMFQSLAWAQTSTLYLQSAQTQTGNGTFVRDLANAIGSAGSVNSNTTNTTFSERLAFTIDISNITSSILGNSFPVSVNISAETRNDLEYRFRLQRLNSTGAVQSSTPYSTTLTAVGTLTGTLSFSPVQTWAPTDRLRLSIEVARNPTGTNTGSMTVSTGNASSFVQYISCLVPTISTPPSNQTANIGGSATFSVTGAGTGLSYQWRKGTTNITGATSASHTISPVASGDAATNYNVVITGSCGTVTSNNVTLFLNPQPSASVTGQTNLTCFGVPGGSITIQASGGSGTGYTFSVDNGATYIGSGNLYTVTGLNANTAYKIRVKDSVGSQSPAIP